MDHLNPLVGLLKNNEEEPNGIAWNKVGDFVNI